MNIEFLKDLAGSDVEVLSDDAVGDRLIHRTSLNGLAEGSASDLRPGAQVFVTTRISMKSLSPISIIGSAHIS
jgi:hypothetical protein